MVATGGAAETTLFDAAGEEAGAERRRAEGRGPAQGGGHIVIRICACRGLDAFIRTRAYRRLGRQLQVHQLGTDAGVPAQKGEDKYASAVARNLD